MKKIFLSITIDTECDKEFDWKVKRPLSFDNAKIKSNQIFYPQHLMNFGAIPTYLLSLKLLKMRNLQKYLNLLVILLNLELIYIQRFIEPEANMNTDNTDLYQKDLTYEIEKQKLENLTNLFFDTFGYRPLSFELGDME